MGIPLFFGGFYVILCDLLLLAYGCLREPFGRDHLRQRVVETGNDNPVAESAEATGNISR